MSAAVRGQVRSGRFRVHQPAGDVAEQRGRGRFQVSRRRPGAGCPSRCRRRSAGSAIGSFAYMAPERFKGTTGPEADVYSLMLAVALVAVLWVLFGHAGKNGGTSQVQATSPAMSFTAPESTIAAEPTIESSTPSQPSIANLPGTDQQGWIGYPAARCDPGTQPAAMARTTQSALSAKSSPEPFTIAVFV
jgi:hypothetical protein